MARKNGTFMTISGMVPSNQDAPSDRRSSSQLGRRTWSTRSSRWTICLKVQSPDQISRSFVMTRSSPLPLSTDAQPSSLSYEVGAPGNERGNRNKCDQNPVARGLREDIPWFELLARPLGRCSRMAEDLQAAVLQLVQRHMTKFASVGTSYCSA